MKVAEMAIALSGVMLSDAGKDREVTSGLTCDLLSWVMNKGKAGMGWVTVQTHINVIAVAALMDMSAVIIPESIKVDEASVAKAREEGIAVISSPLSAYEVCAVMAQNGVPA